MNISMMWLTKIAKIEIPPAVFTKAAYHSVNTYVIL